MAKRHYLAQCYLRGFATREDVSAIWQYEKSTGILRQRGIINVAQRPDFYDRILPNGRRDDQAEKYFGKLETRWPALMSKLDDYRTSIHTKSLSPRKIMTEEDLTTLLHFMLIHSIRAPSKIDWIRDYVRTKHPRADTLTDEQIQYLVIGGMIGTHDDVLNDWIQHMRRKSMNLIICPAGADMNFVTTDDPLYIGGDIRESSTLVVFPVNRRIVVAFGRPGAPSARLERSREEIDKTNIGIVTTATNEIYATESLYTKELLQRAELDVEIRTPSGRKP